MIGVPVLALAHVAGVSASRALGGFAERPLVGIVLVTLAASACGGVVEEKIASEDPPAVPLEDELSVERAELPTEPPHLEADADEGRLEPMVAAPGFTPDPMLREGQTAGGAIDVSTYDERCQGFASAQPDVVLTLERPVAEMLVMVNSPSDTSLVVIDDEGAARCASDDDGAHPIVRGLFARGTHRVWVATAEPGRETPFTLALSEFDGALPSGLTLAPAVPEN